MKHLGICLAAALMASPAFAQEPPPAIKPIGDYTLHDFAAKWLMQQDDIADLRKYRAVNEALIASADSRPRVVLMGDSITFHWEPDTLPAGAGLNVVNRGIAGQNTSQMLLRFEDDVVALKPAVVVILGGTNDLRAYVGDPAAASPEILRRIKRNITAMADIADARGVKVVLGAVTPIGPDLQTLQRDPAAIIEINAWLKSFAASRRYPFADYYSVLADPSGRIPANLSKDGLHPLPEGYRLMWPQLERALGELKIARKP